MKVTTKVVLRFHMEKENKWELPAFIDTIPTTPFAQLIYWTLYLKTHETLFSGLV